MKRWSLMILLSLFATLLPGAAEAQHGNELDRFGIGIGIGLVDLSDSIDDSSTETYIAASFRVLLGDKDKKRDDSHVVAYLEPEISYWESDNRLPLTTGGSVVNSQSDLMIGLNIIGVVPFDRVNYFIGAGLSIHSFDSGLNLDGISIDDEETFGVNIQTGLDVHITDKVDVFGLLRLDLVEDVQEEQAKIVLGLRFNFG